MSIVRATILCLAALVLASGCRDSRSNSPELAAEQNSGDAKTVWLLDQIPRPGGPPKSPEELARNIQYAIQEQDKEMLAALYYRMESDGYKVQTEKIDRSIDLLLRTRRQNLTGIVAVTLSADQILKRETQTFGMSVPVKLTPDVSHEIRFEYRGRLELGEKSRPTSVNAGQHADLYYIATYQIGVAESDDE